jgi:hypothetical protein
MNWIYLKTIEYFKSVVDYFVIVEASKTHSGSEKKLIFLNNKDQFKEFQKKLSTLSLMICRQLVIRSLDLENFQRNAISRAYQM